MCPLAVRELEPAGPVLFEQDHSPDDAEADRAKAEAAAFAVDDRIGGVHRRRGASHQLDDLLVHAGSRRLTLAAGAVVV
jgi:hypothetical protein